MLLRVKIPTKLFDLGPEEDRIQATRKPRFSQVAPGDYEIEFGENPFLDGIKDDFVFLKGTGIGCAKSYMRTETGTFEFIKEQRC